MEPTIPPRFCGYCGPTVTISTQPYCGQCGAPHDLSSWQLAGGRAWSTTFTDGYGFCSRRWDARWRHATTVFSCATPAGRS